MSNVVNLRQARKARDRRAAERRAAENRALHGQTKAAKRAARLEAEKRNRALDDAHLDD